MKTKIMLLALALFVLLIIGCGPSSSGPSVINTNYRTGTEALTITFLPNMPTDKLFAGEQFSIGLNLENKGATGIDEGIITISGYERDQYEFLDGNEKKIQNLRGRDQYTPQGDIASLIFPVKSLCYPEMASQIITNLSTTFRASACYMYSTVAETQVCVDTNPLATQAAYKKPCSVKPITMSGGQGGPIVVTKIEPSMIPLTENTIKARFLITIQNVKSSGIIYAPAAYGTKCSQSNYQDLVEFGASLSGMPMVCTVGGALAKLKLGEPTQISCEIDLNKEGGVYDTTLAIGMHYAYAHSVTKKVQVAKPVGIDLPACK